jgi:hypothetical protein
MPPRLSGLQPDQGRGRAGPPGSPDCIDRASLRRRRSLPRPPVQVTCRWSRSAPMIALQPGAAARVRADAKADSALATRETAAGHRRPARRQFYVEEPTAQLRVGQHCLPGFLPSRSREHASIIDWRDSRRSVASGRSPTSRRHASRQAASGILATACDRCVPALPPSHDSDFSSPMPRFSSATV